MPEALVVYLGKQGGQTRLSVDPAEALGFDRLITFPVLAERWAYGKRYWNLKVDDESLYRALSQRLPELDGIAPHVQTSSISHMPTPSGDTAAEALRELVSQVEITQWYTPKVVLDDGVAQTPLEKMQELGYHRLKSLCEEYGSIGVDYQANTPAVSMWLLEGGFCLGWPDRESLTYAPEVAQRRLKSRVGRRMRNKVNREKKLAKRLENTKVWERGDPPLSAFVTNVLYPLVVAMSYTPGYTLDGKGAGSINASYKRERIGRLWRVCKGYAAAKRYCDASLPLLYFNPGMFGVRPVGKKGARGQAKPDIVKVIRAYRRRYKLGSDWDYVLRSCLSAAKEAGWKYYDYQDS